MTFRFLPHTADVLVEITAPSVETLLADCVAVVRELVAGLSPVAGDVRQTLSVTAGTTDQLVFRFVRELLALFDTEAFVPRDGAGASVTGTGVTAVLRGERFDPARHEAQPEVKAITRHGLLVRRDGDSWRAELLFDV